MQLGDEDLKRKEKTVGYILLKRDEKEEKGRGEKGNG